jgi:hypothetical protein
MLADQVLAGELPKETKGRVENWARREGGAILGKVFLALLAQAGFEESELVVETGFNSSLDNQGGVVPSRQAYGGSHSGADKTD